MLGRMGIVWVVGALVRTGRDCGLNLAQGPGTTGPGDSNVHFGAGHRRFDSR